MVPFKEMVYLQNRQQYAPADEIQPGEAILNLSGTELRRRLQEGEDIPEWFSFRSVIAELRRTHPPRHRQGFTVFFTGLSGAGKSTIANALMAKLMEIGGRPLTLLDGDVVRKHLSSELGFSKEHRNINILRIGYVASEITKNGGIAICAPIAPYAATRREVREMIEPSAASSRCMSRRRLPNASAATARASTSWRAQGKLKQFTGIDDPYEAPEHAGSRHRHAGAVGGPGRRRDHRQADRDGLRPAPRRRGPAACDFGIKRDQEKWVPVFRPIARPAKNPERAVSFGVSISAELIPLEAGTLSTKPTSTPRTWFGAFSFASGHQRGNA